jgi:stage II sporulation protein AA (anti-sigma F factor antagonist)
MLTSVREGHAHVIRLFGELDLATAPEVEHELQGIEQSDAKTIVLDLSQLTFMDSSGVRLVLRAEARSRADSNRLRLRRGPASVQRVFAITGLDGVLPFAD